MKRTLGPRFPTTPLVRPPVTCVLPHCSRAIHRNCNERATEIGNGTNRETCLAWEHPDGTKAHSVSQPNYAEVVKTKLRAERGREISVAFGLAFDERSARRIYPEMCGGEVLVIRPHLLSESAQGYSLLNLREDEGQEEVLEDKDEEEEESEVDEKVKKSERTLNSCMRHGDDHGMITVRCAKDECDNSKTETDYEDCNTTRMLTCSPSVFSRCTHCWVSCCASCRQWCSCRFDRPLNLYTKFFHSSHRENGSFEVLSLQNEFG